MKNPHFWIPLITWIVAVIVITYLIFSSFEMSTSAIGLYIVIIVMGFMFILGARKKRKELNE